MRAPRPWKRWWRGATFGVGVLALVCGVYGFMHGRVEGRDIGVGFWQALLTTLQLFVLNVNGNDIHHEASWWAAFLAPVASSATAIALFGAGANRWREEKGLWFQPATDVFLGGGETATGMAERRQRVAGHGRCKVIALDPSEDAPLARAVESFDAPAFVHVGDALLGDALPPLRLHSARNIWIATGDDRRNLEIARRVLLDIGRHVPSSDRLRHLPRQIAARFAPDRPAWLFVHIGDRRLVRAKEQLFAGYPRDRAVLEFFSMPRLAARTALLTCPPNVDPRAPMPHLLIVGASDLAAALVVQAVQHLIYQDLPSGCVRISLVGAGSGAMHRKLLASFPSLAPRSDDPMLAPLLPLARIRVCECEETALTLEDWKRLQPAGNAFSAVYVACEHDVLTTAAATRVAALRDLATLPGHVPPPVIVACLQQAQGSLCALRAAPAPGSATAPFQVFRVFEQCLRDGEHYPGQTRDLQAMMVQQKFNRRLSMGSRLEDAQADWLADSDEYHWSNRQAADHIAIKLDLLLLRRHVDGQPPRPPDPQVVARALRHLPARKALWRLEHRRFIAERLLDGWLPLPQDRLRVQANGRPDRQQKDVFRLNATLIPFKRLVPAERNKDARIVRATLTILRLISRWSA